MKMIIRCHVKNDARLLLLNNSISDAAKYLGHENVFVLDDQSPMGEQVKTVCDSYGVKSKVSKGVANTINGLIESIRFYKEMNPELEPCIFAVDDFQLSFQFNSEVRRWEEYVLPRLIASNWGLIGTFACYPTSVRDSAFNKDLGLWQIDTHSLYALICHLFSKDLMTVILEYADKFDSGEILYPAMCDDIWVATLCQEKNLRCMNSYLDHAQHTGMSQRTFNDDTAGNSNYYSECFSGV